MSRALAGLVVFVVVASVTPVSLAIARSTLSGCGAGSTAGTTCIAHHEGEPTVTPDFVTDGD